MDRVPVPHHATPSVGLDPRADLLSSMLSLELVKSGTHLHVELHLADDHRPAAASRIAAEIAYLRCGGAPQYYDAWLGRWAGGAEHSGELLACLEAFVASESIGTPDHPAVQVHLEGFVAEHLWYLLVVEDALNRGVPLRVEGPDWSVTDSGGDGLAIYRDGDELSFRLWESKAHSGEGNVRDVVNGAARQINLKAFRYLARFSKIGQSVEEVALKEFYGRLVDLWRDSDTKAGGGVSVATAAHEIQDCFGGIHHYWSFVNVDQRQGIVVVVPDFAEFARLVREQLWRGL